MNLLDIPLVRLDGTSITYAEYHEQVVLVVNVASKCGHTPQYEKLEALQQRYASRGFTVLGFPCNQFAGQEPGTSEQIQEFCTANYGVTFPLFEKTKVNGNRAHPLYSLLTQTPDADGLAGKVKWNFEKFVISPGGEVTRFRSKVQPDAPEVIAAIEAALPAVAA
ncbi:glutathione peroxidase [Parafrigoribacterium soli]|uniref:glutathione peroxidase n=1 Tax=Parafrigoribacterium soli TaxID=3144663 RepID=UPI0032EF3312